MKYLSKLFLLFTVALLTASCGGSDSPDDNGSGSTTLQVSKPVVSSITANSAVVTATATGTGITGRGICYAKSAEPTVNDSKVTASSSSISVTLTGLSGSTLYHVRAYAQVGASVIYSDEVTFTTASGDTPEVEEQQTVGPEALKRVSVHDPSVVWDPSTQNYYIFGSHRDVARSTNMMSWIKSSARWATANNQNANYSVAFSTPTVKKVKKGGVEVDLPAFDALAWSKRGNAGYKIDGNMWAPDVIYNKAMGKWCMYMSINGDAWYSSIVLLTADNITGPYLYQGPVVISGFHTGNAYKDTDLELVIGTQASLPARYNVGNKWGERYPNSIDPCVFYDEQGKLWMSYGSWSGGIYMLELDEQTGLRDYDVQYTLTGSGNGITVDPYFGKKIAGGYYASGEGSYIEYVGGYYFLFMSYGGLAAGGAANDYNNGGYQMRVFRSKNPDGPYVDSKNATALYNSYMLNFGAKENDGNRGVNIFGAYGEWGDLAVGANGERSQGHNSVLAAEDGRTYLVYHTRFQNLGEGHQVRVHQLFQNEDDWLVAAPFEYTGEVVKSAQIAKKQLVATDKIPGKYKVLIHDYKLDHTTKAYTKPVEITLKADGTIEGAYPGTWTAKAGTSYVTIKLATNEYKGVMVMQTLEKAQGTGFVPLANATKAVSFTALKNASGVTIWGYKYADL